MRAAHSLQGGGPHCESPGRRARGPRHGGLLCRRPAGQLRSAPGGNRPAVPRRGFAGQDLPAHRGHDYHLGNRARRGHRQFLSSLGEAAAGRPRAAGARGPRPGRRAPAASRHARSRYFSSRGASLGEEAVFPPGQACPPPPGGDQGGPGAKAGGDRARGAAHGGEPQPPAGPGGRIAGRIALAAAVRRFPPAPQTPADGAVGRAGCTCASALAEANLSERAEEQFNELSRKVAEAASSF